MKEIYELNILEEYAKIAFRPEDGVRVNDSIRRFIIEKTDPKFEFINRIELLLRGNREKRLTTLISWSIRRIYTKDEISEATLFSCAPTTYFEPAGEDCGTQYDEAAACPICGSGARQTTPLIVRLNSIPKNSDLAQTIGSELVVSKRLVDIFNENNITGFSYGPIVNRKGIPATDNWFQFFCGPSLVDIADKTVLGSNPFDMDLENKYRCKYNHQLGLNLISQLYLKAESWSGADINFTRQYIGCRRGVLRPERYLIVSPKIRMLVDKYKLKGFKFDIAHLV